jgi:hypothetical protein
VRIRSASSRSASRRWASRSTTSAGRSTTMSASAASNCRSVRGGGCPRAVLVVDAPVQVAFCSSIGDQSSDSAGSPWRAGASAGRGAARPWSRWFIRMASR